MTCMETKTLFWHFNLRTGTTILVVLIAALNSFALYSSLCYPHLQPSLDDSGDEFVTRNNYTYAVKRGLDLLYSFTNFPTNARESHHARENKYYRGGFVIKELQKIVYSYESIAIQIFVYASCVMAIYSMMKNRRMFLLPFLVVMVGVFFMATMLCCLVMIIMFGVGFDIVDHIRNTSFLEKVLNRYHGDKKQEDADILESMGPVAPLIVILITILCLISIACFWHFVIVVRSLFKKMGEQNGMMEPQMAMYSTCPTAPFSVV